MKPFTFGVVPCLAWLFLAANGCATRATAAKDAASATAEPGGDEASFTVPTATHTAHVEGAETVLLFGPVAVPQSVREGNGVVYLVMEGLTFDASQGNEALFYLLDGDTPAGEAAVDETLYVGSAGHVVGGPAGPLRIINEVHDFDANGVSHQPLSRLRAMKEVFLVMAVRRGSVKFDRALLTTRNPPA